MAVFAANVGRVQPYLVAGVIISAPPRTLSGVGRGGEGPTHLASQHGWRVAEEGSTLIKPPTWSVVAYWYRERIMMSTEPGVVSPGKRLQWLTQSAKRMKMMTVVRGMLSLLLAMVTVGFAAGDAIPDHSMQPTNNYVFTGAPAASTAHMQDFTIANDGALYFKLKSVTPAGTQAKPITVGFMTTTNPNTCSDRYISRITNPTVGQTYGPYYMEAGTYKNYYYHSGVATTSYELEIAYHRQLTPNDTEPNDSMQAPWDIGNITLNTPIAGHLGYLGCKQNTHDYIRFGTLSSGNYRVKIHYDPAFRDKPDCVVWFSLHDDTASSWILSHTGPADVTLGPIAFNASHKYTVSMQSSNTYNTPQKLDRAIRCM